MAKKKQRLSWFDLGRIPLTPAANKSGYEDSKSLLARLQKEEADEQKAAEQAAFLKSPESQIQTLAQEAGKLAGELNAELIACWSRPLGSFTRDESIPDSIALGGYETRDILITDKFTDFTEEHNESYTAFCKELDRRGIEFKSGEAVRKLAAFVVTNVYKAGIKYTPGNWMRCFERLVELGIFDSTMVTGYTAPAVEKPADQVAPQPTPSIADRIEIASDEEAKELVGAAFGKDIQAVFFTWLELNMCNPNVWGIERSVMVSDRIVNFIGEVLDHNPHLNPLRHDTWNFVRRAIDYAMLLGPRGRYLTKDEALACSLEDTPSNPDFATRQDIQRRLDGLR